MKRKVEVDNTWDIPSDKDEQLEYVPQKPQKLEQTFVSPMYDLEGLMNDFPTATELERFVFDQVGLVLNLKGRANKLKYQVAMDVLNGQQVDPVYLGKDNPYIDKNDLVPIDPIKPAPERNSLIPDRSEVQNLFYVNTFPHPDETARALDLKCQIIFRKYKSGMITYEIIGPLDQHPVGEKIDKFGRVRPEVIKWFDPRTGEQIAQREDGSMTPIGRRLRASMLTRKVNKSNQWDVFIDREFVSLNDKVKDNPWDLA